MATGGGETLSRSVGGVRSHPPREAIYSTGSEIEQMEACPEAHSRRRGEIIRGSYRDATIGASFQLGHGPRDIDDQGFFTSRFRVCLGRLRGCGGLDVSASLPRSWERAPRPDPDFRAQTWPRPFIETSRASQKRPVRILHFAPRVRLTGLDQTESCP